MQLRTGVVMLAIAAAAFAAAVPRLNGDEAADGVREIVLADLRFVPNQLNVKVGEAVTVRLINRGTERHDLNFPSLHMPGLEGIQSILEPGTSRWISLRFDQAGTHTFMCTLPGHAAAGMTGAVFVRE